MVNITTRGLFAEPYKSLSIGVATFGRFVGMEKLMKGEDVYVDICHPDVIAHEEGVLYVDADDYRPSTRADSEDETPGMRSDVEELEPYIGGEDLRPSLRAFPES